MAIHYIPDAAGGIPVNPATDTPICQIFERKMATGEVVGEDLILHEDSTGLPVWYLYSWSSWKRGTCRRIAREDAVSRVRFYSPGLRTSDLHRINEHLPEALKPRRDWWGKMPALSQDAEKKLKEMN